MVFFCSSRQFQLITNVFHARHTSIIIQMLYIGTKLHFIPYAAKEIALANGKGFSYSFHTIELYADEVTTVAGLYILVYKE